MQRFFLFVLFTIWSVTSDASIVEVPLTSSGAMMGNMGNAYANKGDTVRFKWQSGSHNVVSTSLPSGVPPWAFTVDASNQTYDVVVNKVGWYDFSMQASIGRVICIDPSLPVRYFEFVMLGRPASENFVVATSDANILRMSDSLLQHPLANRTWHIKGLLGWGNDGYNYNWGFHFQKNKWRMEHISEEGCDGWPSFISTDLPTWIDLQGYFCPWSSVINREVYPTSIATPDMQDEVLVYPNPASEVLNIRTLKRAHIQQVKAVGMAGKMYDLCVENQTTVDISHLPSGLYFLIISTQKGEVSARISVIK